VSDPGPLGNPFEGFGFLGDLAKMLGQQGPLNWDAARQFALMLATEGTPETNVDPPTRIRWAELGRIAELHVQAGTGLDLTVGGRAVEVVAITPGTWAQRTLEAYRPLFENLAGALRTPTGDDDAGLAASGDPGSPDAMLTGLFQMLGPSLLGMSAGSMIGHLARRNFGSYDLPIPRPPSPEVVVLSANVDRFADDWSLPLDDLRLWVCLSELTHHAVLRVPHVHAALDDLIRRFVAGFRPQPDALMERFASLEDGRGDPSDLQKLFSDPAVLLGAMTSPAQQALVPQLDALVAVVLGYVDHTLDRAAPGLISAATRISEAVRRHRGEAGQADQFVERLFGLSLSRHQVERGHTFVAGVIERQGPDGLNRLWQDARALPTPAEVDAPGLWLARLEYDG
jgi:putative hydrolase